MAKGYSPSPAFKQASKILDEQAKKSSVTLEKVSKVQDLTSEMATNLEKMLESQSLAERKRRARSHQEMVKQFNAEMANLQSGVKVFGKALGEELYNAVGGLQAFEAKAVRQMDNFLNQVGRRQMRLDRPTRSERASQKVSSMLKDQSAMVGLDKDKISSLEKMHQEIVSNFEKMLKSKSKLEQANLAVSHQDMMERYENEINAISEVAEVFGESLDKNTANALKGLKKQLSEAKKLDTYYTRVGKKRMGLEKEVTRVQRERMGRLRASWEALREGAFKLSVLKGLGGIGGTAQAKQAADDAESKVRVRNALNLSNKETSRLLSKVEKVSDRLGGKASDAEVYDAARVLIKSGIKNEDAIAEIAGTMVKVSKSLDVDVQSLSAFGHELADKGITDTKSLSAIEDSLAVLASKDFDGSKDAIIRSLSDKNLMNITAIRATQQGLTGKERSDAIAQDIQKLVKGMSYAASFDKDGSWTMEQLGKVVRGEEGAWNKVANAAEIREATKSGDLDKAAYLLNKGVIEALGQFQTSESRLARGREFGLNDNVVVNFAADDASKKLDETFAKSNRLFEQSQGRMAKSMENVTVGAWDNLSNRISKWGIFRWFSDAKAETGMGIEDIAKFAESTNMWVKIIAGILTKEQWMGMFDKLKGLFGGKGGGPLGKLPKGLGKGLGGLGKGLGGLAKSLGTSLKALGPLAGKAALVGAVAYGSYKVGRVLGDKIAEKIDAHYDRKLEEMNRENAAKLKAAHDKFYKDLAEQKLVQRNRMIQDDFKVMENKKLFYDRAQQLMALRTLKATINLNEDQRKRVAEFEKTLTATEKKVLEIGTKNVRWKHEDWATALGLDIEEDRVRRRNERNREKNYAATDASQQLIDLGRGLEINKKWLEAQGLKSSSNLTLAAEDLKKVEADRLGKEREERERRRVQKGKLEASEAYVHKTQFNLDDAETRKKYGIEPLKKPEPPKDTLKKPEAPKDSLKKTEPSKGGYPDQTNPFKNEHLRKRYQWEMSRAPFISSKEDEGRMFWNKLWLDKKGLDYNPDKLELRPEDVEKVRKGTLKGMGALEEEFQQAYGIYEKGAGKAYSQPRDLKKVRPSALDGWRALSLPPQKASEVVETIPEKLPPTPSLTPKYGPLAEQPKDQTDDEQLESLSILNNTTDKGLAFIGSKLVELIAVTQQQNKSRSIREGQPVYGESALEEWQRAIGGNR